MYEKTLATTLRFSCGQGTSKNMVFLTKNPQYGFFGVMAMAFKMQKCTNYVQCFYFHIGSCVMQINFNFLLHF